MGMLVEGRWVADTDRFMQGGAFVRATSTLDREVPGAVIDEISAASGRNVLIASISCPWSHAVMLVRVVKNLGDQLPLHIARPPRVEGYGVDGSDLAEPPVSHIHQLYSLADPEFTGRATVPILWDKAHAKIVSNGSGRIIQGLDQVDGEGGFTLVPRSLASEIGTLSQTIHDNLANAVYRAGLAQRQDAYDEAVAQVFATLASLEDRLAARRYLFGQVVTMVDWRLFATLVRFDAVYTTHFRCTRARLVDHPNLWAYARDLYGWRGVAQTVDFAAIMDGYFIYDGDHNPHNIVAEMPQVDWRAPHDRARLGVAQVWSRRRGPVDAGASQFVSV